MQFSLNICMLFPLLFVSAKSKVCYCCCSPVKPKIRSLKVMQRCILSREITQYRDIVRPTLKGKNSLSKRVNSFL